MSDSGGSKRADCTIIPIPPGIVNYTWALTVPSSYPAPLPPLSGTGSTATVAAKAPGTYACSFTAGVTRECPPPSINIGPKTVVVPDVVSVEWVQFAPESTPLGGCPNNGGKRIFPDKRFAVDPSANIRDKVVLKATLSPAAPGCTVRFQTWDVDDPFDQRFGCPAVTPDGRPCVPGAAAIDGNASGPDNRGGDPGVVSGAAPTDATGVALFTVTMSMQPGNNYRGGASGFGDAMAAATQALADADTPPRSVVFTHMLTVWRRVWLELDSMGPGADISYTGVIDAITNNAPHAADGTVELDVPDINDNGRFEGGTMTVSTTGSFYTIIDNIDRFVDDLYTMSTLVAAGDFGQTATVVDDDTAVLPRIPDANITVLNAKYRNAYVEFFENAATRDNTNTFVRMMPLEPSNVFANAALENADLTPANDLWLVIVVSAYQPYNTGDATSENASTADGDPDIRFHIHGSTWLTGDTTVVYAAAVQAGSNVVMFFQETSIDSLNQDAAGYTGLPVRPLSFLEPQTIAHEIGHVFGLSDVGLGTLMGPYDGADPDFDASEISQIRSSSHLGSH